MEVMKKKCNEECSNYDYWLVWCHKYKRELGPLADDALPDYCVQEPDTPPEETTDED